MRIRWHMARNDGAWYVYDLDLKSYHPNWGGLPDWVWVFWNLVNPRLACEKP